MWFNLRKWYSSTCTCCDSNTKKNTCSNAVCPTGFSRNEMCPQIPGNHQTSKAMHWLFFYSRPSRFVQKEGIPLHPWSWFQNLMFDIWLRHTFSKATCGFPSPFCRCNVVKVSWRILPPNNKSSRSQAPNCPFSFLRFLSRGQTICGTALSFFVKRFSFEVTVTTFPCELRSPFWRHSKHMETVVY